MVPGPIERRDSLQSPNKQQHGCERSAARDLPEGTNHKGRQGGSCRGIAGVFRKAYGNSGCVVKHLFSAVSFWHGCTRRDRSLTGLGWKRGRCSPASCQHTQMNLALCGLHHNAKMESTLFLGSLTSLLRVTCLSHLASSVVTARTGRTCYLIFRPVSVLL